MKQVMKTFSVALMGLAMGTGAFAQTAYTRTAVCKQ